MEEPNPETALAGAAPPPIGRIKVRIKVEANGGCLNYAIEPDDQASVPYVLAGNKIAVSPGPTTTIEFKIQGPVAGQLDFNENDPIWISQGGCPQGPCIDPSVTITECKNNKLEISDANLDQVDLHYRLNFLDRAGAPYYWDPIIRNGGGGP